ncbi:14918_t:CDS:1, partial [Funneliformis mosseae]
TRPFREFLKPYRAEPRKLRRYRKRHASRAHSGENPTPEHLKYLSRIALRQESD